MDRRWSTKLHSEIRAEVAALPKPVRLALSAALVALEIEGPDLGGLHVDTLQGSRHANMKELRFDAHLERMKP